VSLLIIVLLSVTTVVLLMVVVSVLTMVVSPSTFASLLAQLVKAAATRARAKNFFIVCGLLSWFFRNAAKVAGGG
jgi:hypothetical protein